MSRGSITREYVAAVADGIRYANGTENTYTPAQMGNAVRALKKTLVAKTVNANGEYNPASDSADGYSAVTVAVPGPVLQQKTATQNGDVTPDSGYDGLSKVVVAVPGAQPVIQSLSVTQNGTYSPPSGVDGYGPVTVNVSGGGGGLSISTAEAKFVNSYSRNGIELSGQVSSSGDVTATEMKAEYYGTVYDNSAMITDLGLVLLADFSQGGESSGNALSESIENYSGVVLQGIYQKQRTSGYNTTYMYCDPNLNTAYWAGMKDRNATYDCNVTFTDNQTVSLSGNKQVIIYGIP